MTYSPLQGAKLVLITFALSLAVFMEVLDSTIANVAVPVIAGDLGAAATQGTWVITSFAVANAVSIPLTGFIARRFGEVRVFVGAVAGFVVTSALCGMAQSLEMLVFSRVLQGLLAGPMIPLSQSLLMACYPPEKRTLALALWAMTIVVAPIFGPILGGWISDSWHWGWIFFINIPIGIAAGWLSWRILKDRETQTARQPIDKIGLVLLVFGVGALQMMLDRGKELDWFASAEIVTLAVVALVCLSYFVVWELGEKNPIVDLTLFKDRNFTVGVIVTSLGFMVYMGTLVQLTMVLQTQLGYTATWAGLVAAPVGILPVFLSPLIGRFGGRLDMRILVTCSFLVFAGCFIWRTRFYAGMDLESVMWPQFWQGLGVAMFFIPLTTITLSRMQGHMIASAGGLSNFLRVLAGGVGASVATTLWERRGAFHHSHLVERITPYSDMSQATVNSMVQAGMSPQQAYAGLEHSVSQQSLIMGSNDVFWMAAVLCLSLIMIVWLAKPPFMSGHKK